ncbi:hypothetical protein DERP_004835 [Dermatophagoides pteronyssinus]|uniref:CUB domain-containing protein n=1 Tax=Dermatophagoides pteronyssinus TaxID=6956 RepID=A0ABQ8JTI5_DERPT|nr:hypothetical protein DERP_004835 [Dermatophagoides pteronyssinus]
MIDSSKSRLAGKLFDKDQFLFHRGCPLTIINIDIATKPFGSRFASDQFEYNCELYAYNCNSPGKRRPSIVCSEPRSFSRPKCNVIFDTVY